MIYLHFKWGGYTKSEVDTLLTGKADTSHTHTKSQITDFPTIPSKTSDLTNDSGFITSEIDSMGEGWVRFKSGLQICYGMVTNDNNIDTGRARFSFPKAFSASPSLVATPNIPDFYTVTATVESGTTWTLSSYQLWGAPNIGPAIQPLPVNYVAIGKWK